MTISLRLRLGLQTLALPFSVALLTACAGAPQETSSIEPAAPEPVARPEPRYAPFPDDSFHDLLVAEFAIRRQQYDLALNNYMRQAERTRDSGVIATAARLAQFINDDESALSITDLWLEQEPDAAEPHFIKASALAKMRRPVEALDHMVRVLGSEHETNFAALSASALSLAEPEQQRYQNRLLALLAEHPDNPNLKTGVALLLQYRDQEEKSLELIREVLALDPGNIHALLIETRVLQQLDRNDEAIERLRFAVDQHPQHKRLRLNLAQLLARSDIYQAKAQYTVLDQQHPEDGSIGLALALINQEIGDLDEAKRLLNGLLSGALHRDSANYFLGRIAEQEQRWQDAINHYRNVGPGKQILPALTRMIQIQNDQQGIDKARPELRAAREQYPTLAIQLYLLESDLLFDQRHYAEGHNLLSRALEQHPQNTNLLYARSLFSERRKNVELMEQDLRLILSNDPDNATALNALGYSLAILTDRLEEARSLVSKALQLRPDDPAIQDSFGWIAFRQGNLSLAESYLRQAYEQSKDHEIAAHLGEVLWHLSQRQQALGVWQEGLNHTPDSPIILETLQRLKVNLPDSATPTLGAPTADSSH